MKTRVVCLSLSSRPDRWQAFMNSVATSTVLSSLKIEKYRATLPNEMIIPDWWPKDIKASHYATRVDHLRLWERSYVQKDDSLLIFEDDAIIQPGFDQAYHKAMSLLPNNWKGLYFSTDQQVKPSSKIADGLLRCRQQIDLHAYMLNQAGMHRYYSHVTHQFWRILDWAISELHSTEPHFYSVDRNVVIQGGSRDSPNGIRKHSKR